MDRQPFSVKRPLASALLLALGLPASSHAAPAMDAAADPLTVSTLSGSGAAAAQTLDGVEVNGHRARYASSPKLTEPLLDTPQTITVVTSELMQAQGVTSLREALGNVPGISLQAGEGGVPAGDNLTLRGFSARTDLFIDGVRDFGGYARDPFNIEQIEVIKGPASTQSGRGSTGGSINLASKTAQPEAFQRASISAGAESLWRLTADLNQPLGGNAALRVNTLAHEGGVAGRDALENQRYGIAPTLNVGLGEATLDFSLFHLQQDNVPDYGHPWVPATNTALVEHRDGRSPVERENWYGLLARDYEDTRTDLATAVFELPLAADLRLRNLTRWGRSERDSIITAPRFLSNNSTDIRRTAKTRDSEDRILANVTDLVANFASGSVQHTLVAGIEFAREESVNLARAASDGDLADLYAPDPNAPYTGSISRDTLRDASADADSVAAYVFDTAALNEHWELSGGLRWDRFDVRSEGYVTALAAREQFARDDSMLSGRAAVMYKPQEDHSYYLGYGTAFNPSAEGLSMNPDTAGLEPEESRTVELGGKWSLFSDQLLLAAAVFRTEKTNARTEDADEVVVLAGRQRVDGIELSASGELSDDWTVFAAYTFLDSDVLESLNPAELGNELGNTPRHSASLWTTWQASERLQLGLGARHVGARWSNTSNTRQAESYSTIDAMAAFDFNEQLRLRFNATNLGDRDYIETVGGGHYTPGAGRSWQLSLDLNY